MEVLGMQPQPSVILMLQCDSALKYSLLRKNKLLGMQKKCFLPQSEFDLLLIIFNQILQIATACKERPNATVEHSFKSQQTVDFRGRTYLRSRCSLLNLTTFSAVKKSFSAFCNKCSQLHYLLVKNIVQKFPGARI